MSGEAGGAIGEKAGEEARTDVPKSHEQLTRGLSQDRHVGIVIDVQLRPERRGCGHRRTERRIMTRA